MKNRFDLPQISSMKTCCRYLLACTLYCLAATTAVVQASPTEIVAVTPGVNEVLLSSSLQANHVFVDEAVQGLPLSAAAGDQHTFQLISHGRPGGLYLDGAWRDAPEIAEWLQQEQLLAGQTQLNIYGCEFAKGPEGQAAVTFLEATLGISVAASDDLTGIDGDWELEVGLAVDELKLPHYRFNLQCADPADAPTASVFAIQPSCSADGSTINTDGYLQISAVTGGLSYQVAIDGGVFGPRADIGATFPAIILSSQSNPAGSRDYIVRIYEEDMNGASACFTDFPVTMQQQDCTVGCDCEEYLYLNDEVLGVVHKFKVNRPDGSLTEITDANGNLPFIDGAGLPGGFPSPHGLATDNNGFIYIARNVTDNDNEIYKFNCAGELVEEDFIGAAPYGRTNFVSANGVLYEMDETDRIAGDAGEPNGQSVIRAYELCTGNEIGTMLVGSGDYLNFNTWGFYGDDTYWYLAEWNPAGDDAGDGCVYRGLLDPSLYSAPATPANAGTQLFCTDRWGAMGFTSDDAGNFYVIVNQEGNGTSTSKTLKRS